MEHIFPALEPGAESSAARLVERFGSLGGVLSARPAALEAMGCTTVELRVLAGVREALKIAAHEELTARPVVRNLDALVGYLKVAHAHETIEMFRVLFINAANRMIADEVLWKGCVSEVAVYPRQIVTRSLELGASAIVLVHNHPSGDPTPSIADKDMTKRICAAAWPLEIRVLDHLIIARDGWTSFHSQGLL